MYYGADLIFLLKVYLSLLGDYMSILIQIFYFSWLAHQNFPKLLNSYKVTYDREQHYS